MDRNRSIGLYWAFNTVSRQQSTPSLGAANERMELAENIEKTVKLLLSRDDVAADSRDGTGRTPLSWASTEAAVKLLLDREDVAKDSMDRSGRTPLSWAAGDGRTSVVQ
jgi:ankyrin repeat protein